MSAVLQTSHVIPQWQVYPRVHYFRKRLIDLHTRFTRVLGQLENSINDRVKLYDIEESVAAFRQALEVVVVGNRSLESSHYVADIKPLEEHATDVKNEAGVHVVICYACAQTMDSSLMTIITETAEYFASNYRQYTESMFFVVDVTDGTTSDQQANIVARLNRMLPLETDWSPAQRLSFETGDTILATNISLFLENRLMTIFHQIYDYLQWLVPRQKVVHSRPSDILMLVKRILRKTDICGCLYDRKEHIIYKDGSNITICATECEINTSSKLMYDKLAKMIKCILVSLFTGKYKLRPSVINSLLEEKRLEVCFSRVMSDGPNKSLRAHIEHISRMITLDDIKGNKAPNLMKSCRYALAEITNCMSTTFDDIIGVMVQTERVVMVMNRMLFEVEGYFQQTITETFKSTSKPPVIPLEMRKEILSLDAVYSLGAVYDQFEIYLYPQSEDNNGSIDGGDLWAVKRQIAEICRRTGFRAPYSVKVLRRAPSYHANVLNIITFSIQSNLHLVA